MSVVPSRHADPSPLDMFRERLSYCRMSPVPGLLTLGRDRQTDE